MMQSNWLFIFSLAVPLAALIIPPVGPVEGENGKREKNSGLTCQDPETIANQFLDRLQLGYETADIPMLASLYDNPTVAVDVTRNENHFYTAASLQAEMAQALTGLTGIKCSFTDRQISAEGEMIMIRAMRSVTANEVPIIANCLMLMVLRKQSAHNRPWDYIVTDQILLKEEYVPKQDSDGGEIVNQSPSYYSGG